MKITPISRVTSSARATPWSTSNPLGGS
jgi:hypothetical protein